MKTKILIFFVIIAILLGMKSCTNNYYDEKLRDMNRGLETVLILGELWKGISTI